jgi:arylsulfatase A-like enzyme
MTLDLRLYDGEISYVDQQLGRIFSLLDDASLTDKTLIVFTSDHGEHLTEHDYYGHALRLFEPSLRIPLIVKPAGGLPERVDIPALAQSVDILPTVLECLSIPVPPGLNGRSLVGVMEEPASGLETFSYGETRHTGRKQDFCYSIRTEKWKFILWPEKDLAELYDLQADPGELTNLAEERPEIAGMFKSRLEAMLAAQQQDDDSTAVDMDDETRDMLKSLGYL